MQKEEITITASDFVETPQTPLSEDAGKVFNVDDRVSFNFEDKFKGTGTILGLALVHQHIRSYIVLLDKPLEGQKAILVGNTLMQKLTTKCDRCFGMGSRPQGPGDIECEDCNGSGVVL